MVQDPMPIDPSMFGRSLVSGSTYWEIPAKTFQRWDQFRLGVNREYALKFLLDPGAVAMTITLSETLFDPRGQTISQLPDGVQREVDKAKAAEVAKPKKPVTKDVIPPG